MFRSLLIVLSFLFLPKPDLAQINLGPKVGYIYQKSSYLEADLNIYKKIKGPAGALMGFYAIQPGSDFRIGGSKFICGSKIMYEEHVGFFGGRARFTANTDFKMSSYQLSAEGD